MANNPTVTQVHYPAPLTNFSLMWVQENDNFVADKVFKNVPVGHKTDLYYEWNRADFNRNNVKERAAGTESQGAGMNVNANKSYTAKVYSLHHDISDQERDNADNQLNLDFASTEFLTMQMLIDKEQRFVNNYFTTGVWTNQSTPSHLWSASGSTPIEDIRAMKRTVQLSSGGFKPNTLVFSRTTYDYLIDNPEIVSRIVYSVKNAGEAATVSKNTLAQLFEVDQVLVTDAVVNTAAETELGAGSDETNSFIAGPSALLVYVPKGQPTLNTIAAGLTFSWTGQYGATAAGTRMLSIPMPWIASTRIEAEAAYAQTITSKDLGGFFYNCV